MQEAGNNDEENNIIQQYLLHKVRQLKHEKQLKIESEGSEKPYWTINGRSFVMSKGGWASTDDFTDIIFADGKRMTPDEVNKNIKRSSISGVGATDGEGSQNKYGLNQPVLAIYINTSPETDIVFRSAAKEQEAILKGQEVRIKEQDRRYNERKQLYDQQHQLAMQREAMQKQKNEVEKWPVLAKEQSEQAKEHEVQAKKQLEQAKEQQALINAVKQEMLKDGLIQNNEHYELIINSSEMLINGKKQATSVHEKYIELINSKRKKERFW